MLGSGHQPNRLDKRRIAIPSTNFDFGVRFSSGRGGLAMSPAFHFDQKLFIAKVEIFQLPPMVGLEKILAALKNLKIN